MAAIVWRLSRYRLAILVLVAATLLGVGWQTLRLPATRRANITISSSASNAPSPDHTARPTTPPTAPVASSSPNNCDVHIQNTDPNSHTQINCVTKTATARTTSNVSVNNTNSQSTSSGNVNNSSSSTTTINIQN